MSLLWQLRHSIAHNEGVVTKSDALKLRLLVRANVPSPKSLCPTRDDLRHVKRFIEETAEDINRRVAKRLSELLTELYHSDHSLFVPREEAAQVRKKFNVQVSLARRPTRVSI